jgi:hypothetical protein
MLETSYLGKNGNKYILKYLLSVLLITSNAECEVEDFCTVSFQELFKAALIFFCNTFNKFCVCQSCGHGVLLKQPGLDEINLTALEGVVVTEL